jgi:hypothetical protein
VGRASDFRKADERQNYYQSIAAKESIGRPNQAA